MSIYSKYSNERARQFAIRTDICKKADGEKSVRKYALYPEGREHICHMEKSYEKLSSCYADSNEKIRFCACHTKNDAAVSGFDPGVTLQDVMERAIERNQTELVKRILDDYAKRIHENQSRTIFCTRQPKFSEKCLERFILRKLKRWIYAISI